MMKTLVVLALVAVYACSRNPDPEYAPDGDASAAAANATAASPAVSAAEVPGPASAVQRLSDDEAYRLGREAVALLFANDIPALFERFGAEAKAEIQSADNFAALVHEVFAQTGAEGALVEEAIETDPEHPGFTIYRRRGNYLAIGQDLDLFVALNADGSIGGLNILPIQ